MKGLIRSLVSGLAISLVLTCIVGADPYTSAQWEYRIQSLYSTQVVNSANINAAMATNSTQDTSISTLVGLTNSYAYLAKSNNFTATSNYFAGFVYVASNAVSGKQVMTWDNDTNQDATALATGMYPKASIGPNFVNSVLSVAPAAPWNAVTNILTVTSGSAPWTFPNAAANAVGSRIMLEGKIASTDVGGKSVLAIDATYDKVIII